MKLTTSDKDRMITTNGNLSCPGCNCYDNMYTIDELIKESKIFNKTRCMNCSSTWTEVYTLTSIINEDIKR